MTSISTVLGKKFWRNPCFCGLVVECWAGKIWELLVQSIWEHFSLFFVNSIKNNQLSCFFDSRIYVQYKDQKLCFIWNQLFFFKNLILRIKIVVRYLLSWFHCFSTEPLKHYPEKGEGKYFKLLTFFFECGVGRFCVRQRICTLCRKIVSSWSQLDDCRLSMGFSVSLFCVQVCLYIVSPWLSRWL